MIDHHLLVTLFVQRTKSEQASIAQGAMLRPSNDLHTSGLTAGKWQGLQIALDILEGILNEDEKKERS